MQVPCRYLSAGLLLCLLMAGASLPVTAASTVAGLEKQLVESERSGASTETVTVLVQLSDAMVDLGSYQDSLSYLNRALALTGADDVDLRATVLARLADAYLVTGDVEQASASLDEAFSLLDTQGSSAVKAVVLLNLGNLHAHKNDAAAALQDYRRALHEANNAGDSSVAANALTNIARLKVNADSPADAYSALQAAVDKTAELPDGYDKAFLQISLGRLGRGIKPGLESDQKSLLLLEYKLFQQAARIAESLPSARLASQAYGSMGELYADEQRFSEAERLLQKAVFLAREAGANDILYNWQWQLGRLKANTGQLDAAIQDYRDAVLTLQLVRPRFEMGMHRQRGPFRETTGPLYYELADLLLRAPASDASAEKIESRLHEARQTVELLKAVELEDYFQDNCVTALATRTSGVDSIAPHTAILYVIELPDRLELLLSLPNGIEQVTVPVPGDELHAEIVQFRRHLEKRTTRQYLRQARKLYDWMIRPVEPLLKASSITTLVTVPQGSMTTIPFSALNDGKLFLIEKYALATTPGLKLTDPGSMDKTTAEVLLAGLSEAVQGFPPLPNVPAELAAVKAAFGGNLIENQEFSYANMSHALEQDPYPVVHIATHAQFKGRSEDTFLLAWNEQLDLDRLQSLIGLSEFRTEPVELLVLSACQTAVGDEQAALGLAGVAVKAGARSALASLWFVNDESTSRLVTEFYQHYKQPGVSKAQALQAAQIEILQDLKYRHPGYWAPFLLIGNWL